MKRNMTLQEALAIQVCEWTSGGEGTPGMHVCECATGDRKVCDQMMRAAQAALLVLDCAEFSDNDTKRQFRDE